MSDDVLDRLLEVEKEAAEIVDDAQKKASALLTEADREERLLYNEKYKEEVARMNKEKEACFQKFECEYSEELASYQKELDAESVNYEAFNKIMENALFSNLRGGGGES